MIYSLKNLKSSVSLKIIRYTLGFYLLVAFTLTIFQIIVEFSNIKQRIIKEFHDIASEHSEIIQESFLKKDNVHLEKAVKRIVKHLNITALILFERDKTIRLKIKKDRNIGFIGNIFSSEFMLLIPLYSKNQSISKKEKFGEILFFSNNSIITDELQPKVFIIFINGLFKTLTLMLILLFAINKFISLPLNKIKYFIKGRQSNNNIVPPPNQNELSDIYISIKTLIESNDKTIKGLNELLSSFKMKNEEYEVFSKMLQKEIGDKNELLLKAHLSSNESMKIIQILKGENKKKNIDHSPKKITIEESIEDIFLSKINHEFRTPLNAILGFSNIMLKKNVDESLIFYLKSIEESGKSLLKLINNLFDISKSKSNSLKFEYKPISIKNLFYRLENILSEEVISRNNKLNFFISNSFPKTFFLDEFRLYQIISNIISSTNSVFIHRKILISCESDQIDTNDQASNLTFTIRSDLIEDSSFKKQDKVIPPIEQRIDQINFKNSLGITLSKNLSKLMNGHLEIKSKENEEFIFILKFSKVKMTNEEIYFSLKSKVSQLYTFKNAKILIAENDPLNIKILKSFLEGHNLIIKFCSDGHELIEQTKTLAPDLIMMERSLPLINGIKVAEEIKRFRSIKDIPLIILTSSPDLYNDPLISHLFNDFILKPFQENGLILKLIKYLDYDITETSNLTKDLRNELKFSFSDSSEDSLKKVYEVLNSSHWIEQYQNILETLTINEIEKFSQELIILGEKYKVKEIIKIGEKLLFEIVHFDMEGISKTLKIFEQIKKRLALYK
jgi:CheY-like chemotaxis protein/nitrogen-specific signal transduction histidine kinase